MKRTLIIAEAGVNHNGSTEIAKQLIDAAYESGADIVKFQTFKAEKLVSKAAKKAVYQIENMKEDTADSQFDMLKKLELTVQDHHILKSYCEQKGIEFWSTAFDEDSIQLLRTLGIKRWKIPSGEVTNLPLLQTIGTFNEEVILSSGMCTLDEIKDALKILISSGTSIDKITVLHCNTEYPTPMHDVNLNAMIEIRNTLGVKTGYSDHTTGIEIPIAAVALGALVIEKHFTLDRNLEGPDHKASLEPDELKAMVKAIRNIEQALGDGIKNPSASEIKNISIARKSIHLKHDLFSGHIITKDDLMMKRPGDGISPMKMYDVIGKKTKYPFLADHKLSINDIE